MVAPMPSKGGDSGRSRSPLCRPLAPKLGMPPPPVHLNPEGRPSLTLMASPPYRNSITRLNCFGGKGVGRLLAGGGPVDQGKGSDD